MHVLLNLSSVLWPSWRRKVLHPSSLTDTMTGVSDDKRRTTNDDRSEESIMTVRSFAPQRLCSYKRDSTFWLLKGIFLYWKREEYLCFELTVNWLETCKWVELINCKRGQFQRRTTTTTTTLAFGVGVFFFHESTTVWMMINDYDSPLCIALFFALFFALYFWFY